MDALAQAWGAHSLGLFALTVLTLNATPGVDVLCTLSHTLQGGWRAGVAAAAGICAGCAVHVILAAAGLAALLTVATGAFTALKGVGAAYLVYLAWGMARKAWRQKGGDDGDAHAADEPANRRAPSTAIKPPPMAAPSSPKPWVRVAFRQGLLTNLLNPKVALFVLALLPQFIVADAEHKTAAFVLLGLWLVLQSLLFLLALVALTTLARPTTPSPHAARALNGLGAALFLALAAKLALSDLQPQH